MLIFDQFEEFFFDHKDTASKREFYEFLRECVEIPYVKVILSLREDYISYLLELNRTTPLTNSPDGKIIASASVDKTVKLWRINGTLIQSQQKHKKRVFAVSFSPNAHGKTLASASMDGRVILWNFDLDDLLIRGCNWLRDYLKTNPNISEEDRHLCDGIGTQE
ncbi:MAG: hypothetical protein RLO19_16035 [Coleofasciculus sp. G2-EDA-02]